MYCSNRAKSIKPAILLSVTAKASRLKAQGRQVIGLGVGEPDFDTPQHIKDAAQRAMAAGLTKYTAVDGLPSLKQAIIAKLARDNGLRYAPNQVIVSCGGKHSFFNLIQAVINPGDEVLIPAPYWPSFPDIVALADGIPVALPTTITTGFKITPRQLEAAITPRTKMLIINSPSNPTGSVYSEEELAALGAVLRRHQHVLILSDDMYEHILLDERPFVNLLNACPDLHDRTILLNGVSKAYAMTGWRIGYAAGPEAIISAMVNVQSQSTSNPTSIAQAAAEAALDGDQSCIAPMVEAFRERHRFVLSQLNIMEGVKCLPAGGAFYLFADVHGAITRLHRRGVIAEPTDLALSDYLLEAAGISLVPGSAFGAPGHLRISFATSMANLAQAMANMGAALSAKGPAAPAA